MSDGSRSSRSSAPGCSGAVGHRVPFPDHDACAAVGEAMVELLLGEPPGERDEHRAGPLSRPVEQCGLEPVVEHDGEAFALCKLQPAGQPADAREQRAVGELRKGLDLRVALAGGKQGLGEIHRCSAASEDRVHDRLVASAAAEVPREQVDDLVAGRPAAFQQVARLPSGCRACRSRTGARDAHGTRPATVSARRLPRDPRPFRSCRRRPGLRAGGRSARRHRPGAPCRRRTRRARSRRAFPAGPAGDGGSPRAAVAARHLPGRAGR